jgi:protein-disulfide isomerase
LISKDDTHNSDGRLRAIWKYGASVGISATPQVIINGVMVDNYPTTEAAWKDLIKQIEPAPAASNMFLY